MNNSPESLVSNVLEPGEQVIWTGRPQVDMAMSGRRHRWRVTKVAGIALMLVLAYWLVPEATKLKEQIQAMEMKKLLPIIGFFVVGTLLTIFGPNVQLKRYFQRLSYAITNRRLLIFERDRLTESYPPERVFAPSLEERAGRADVIFGRRRTKSQPGAVTRERAEVGFKAISNAPEVKQLIEDWLEDSLKRAEAQVSDYLEPPASGTGSSGGRRRIENRRAGLRLQVPAAWTTSVRSKKQPIGSFFLDVTDWQSPETAQDWNTVLVEGPAQCKVELEIFETVPTLTLESLSDNKMAYAFAGEVVDSDPDIEINGLRGFSVTRRAERAIDRETHTAGPAAMIAPERQTVLHDGRRQVYIHSSWPERSSQLERAVDAVVKSIELD